MRKNESDLQENRRRGGFGLPLGLILLFLLLSFPSASLAAELSGEVVAKNGEPKAGVRVELVGPQKKLAITDGQGKFSTSLKDGSYSVRITDGKRNMVFENVDVRKDRSQTFTLLW